MQGSIYTDIGSVFDKPAGKRKKGPGRKKNRIIKKSKNYYLSKATIDSLETKAGELGLNFSVLLGRILKFGLKNIKLIDVYND